MAFVLSWKMNNGLWLHFNYLEHNPSLPGVLPNTHEYWVWQFLINHGKSNFLNDMWPSPTFIYFIMNGEIQLFYGDEVARRYVWYNK